MKNRFQIVLWSLCVLFPLVFVWIVPFVLSDAQLRPFNFQSEFMPRLGQTFLAVFPLVCLVLFVRRQSKQQTAALDSGARWAVGGVFSFAFITWGWYSLDSIRVDGGANIGMGLLMLIYPFLSLIIMVGFFGIGYGASKFRVGCKFKCRR